MYLLSQGGNNNTIYVWIKQDNSGANPGEAKTGLVWDSVGAKSYYLRPRGLPVQITLGALAAADSVFSAGGFKEVDAANMPGVYRHDLPNALAASGENFAVGLLQFDGAVDTPFQPNLSPFPPIVLAKVVADAGNSATQFKTDLTDTDDDAFNDTFCTFRTGNRANEAKRVIDYDGSTKIVTVESPGYSAAPATNDEFIIVNR